MLTSIVKKYRDKSQTFTNEDWAEFENDLLWQWLNDEWNLSKKGMPITTAQWLNVFSDNKKQIVRLLKSYIDAVSDKIFFLHKSKQYFIRKYPAWDDRLILKTILELTDEEIAGYQKLIKKWRFLIISKESASERNVEHARAVPIEVILPHPPRRESGNYTVKCPLHEDRSPSFSVNREKNLWYCHAGCGGGDVITLVQKLYKLTFPEAVDKLNRL